MSRKLLIVYEKAIGFLNDIDQHVGLCYFFWRNKLEKMSERDF